jgi:hypothetical protein
MDTTIQIRNLGLDSKSSFIFTLKLKRLSFNLSFPCLSWFQSFVAKCCKMCIIQPCEVCRFSVFFYYAREIDSPIGCWGINFPFVIQNDWKLQIAQDYIIHIIIQHFATKLSGILLILWCSFKLWWNFCLDQNLVYNANGPFGLVFIPSKPFPSTNDKFNPLLRVFKWKYKWNTRNAAFYHPVKCCLRVLQNIPFKSRVTKWQGRDRRGWIFSRR